MTAESRRPNLAELTGGQLDAEDGRALGQVADVFSTLDPVPSGLVERIQFGITLESLHAEIAELQRGSALAGVRAEAAAEIQTVTFTSASLTTMVTITPLSADRARIDGWVAPGGGVQVELRVVGSSLTTLADADGRFVFEDVPRGLVQLVLRRPGTPAPPPVITPSIEL